MQTQAPGTLTASRVAVLSDGSVAEVVIAEHALPYAVKRADAFARWFSDGAWSAWRVVAESAFDVSIAPDVGHEEPTALISVIIWVPAPAGGIAAQRHVMHQSAFYRLTASRIVPADDL
jgi:hypothetical protein